MTTMPRYVHLNNWIFEIKAVRALRVDKFGDPYSAIASLTVNGDNAYFDGLMTKENEAFTRQDFQTFKDFCAQLDVKHANFDRYKSNEIVKEQVRISSPRKNSATILQLVK